MNNSKETINSIMQFKNYKVLKLRFDDVAKNENNTSFQVDPKFLKDIEKIDSNNFKVTLGCKIESSKESPFPFNLEAIIQGYFYIDKMDGNERIMQENSLAILFPYLRSTISMLTIASNVNALILPTINIAKLFEEYDNNTNNTKGKE